MAGLRILIGADKTAPVYEFEYSKSHIMSFSGTAASSLVGDELTIDRVTFTVNLEKYYRTIYAPEGADAYRDTAERLYAVKEAPGTLAADLLKLEYATPVWVYQGEHLVGKFYSGDVERTGYAVISITIESALGVLDRQQHLGNVYTGQLFPAVLSEIIGGVFPFTVSDALAEAKVYNWLPIDSKRNNIHQLLFAHGANLTKDENGDMVFDYLEQAVATPVPEERLFLNGSAKYTPPATRVEVMEHSFFKLATDADVVLFDNTDGVAPAGNSFVAFQEAPVYGLAASSGLVIHESGVNYAIVSGIGVLTGKRYNHQTNRVGRDNEDTTGVEKIVTSDGCTLVSVLNSSNVTRRLLSYYSSAQTFTMDLAVEGEKPGDQLQFMSPFGDLTAAFLATMQYSITGFMRARCEMVTNYEPTPPGGGGYANVEVITESGIWTVPEGITEFTAVLIGGGSGGSGGYDGKAGASGKDATASYGGTASASGGSGGSGGAAGSAGSGGKIFQVRLDTVPGTKVTATIGQGGAGGTENGGAAGNGGDTRISIGASNYTSADGAASPSGYFDVISQTSYAMAGTPGTAGGDGGAGNAGNTTGRAQSGAAVGSYSGGAGGLGASKVVPGTKYSKPDVSLLNNPDGTYVKRTLQSASLSDSKRGYSNGLSYLDLYQDSAIQPNGSGGAWSVPDANKTITPIYEYANFTYSDFVAYAAGSTLYIVAYQVNDPAPAPVEVKEDRFTITPFRETGYGYTMKTMGGGGGGAASAARGSSGVAGVGDANYGGKGADGTKPADKTVPGTGGDGGNGGGGGGGGGGAQITTQENVASATVPGGNGGAGGLGSAGGAGAPGCVLIYY